MSKERGEATEVSPAKLKHALLRPEGPPFNSHNREVVVKD